MIKRYQGFLESSNNGFDELEGLIEKEVAYLNLINDIVQRYEDEHSESWELSYEFGKDITFYHFNDQPRESGLGNFQLRSPIRESTVRNIINNNGEICLDKEDPFYSHGIGPVPRPRVISSSNDLLKQILKSSTGTMEYDIYFYRNSLGKRISVTNIVNEIKSQYPFTRIEVDPMFRSHHKHNNRYTMDQIDKHRHLHFEVDINDIRDNI
jgi:hypothetical protein